jgi:hypothetical protein
MILWVLKKPEFEKQNETERASHTHKNLGETFHETKSHESREMHSSACASPVDGFVHRVDDNCECPGEGHRRNGATAPFVRELRCKM